VYVVLVVWLIPALVGFAYLSVNEMARTRSMMEEHGYFRATTSMVFVLHAIIGLVWPWVLYMLVKPAKK
jgi:hypothetical protein